MLRQTLNWRIANTERLTPPPRWRSICHFATPLLFAILTNSLFADDRPDSTTVPLAAISKTVNEDSSQSASTNIAELIAQLDSQNFSVREKASSDLAALGERALGPLAYYSFQCSPESCWRIKKTLEKICTSGTESVFLKAIAILNLRFNVGNYNNPELEQSLSKLEAKWRRKRKATAIAKLRKNGASVSDPLEDIDTNFQQLPVWRGGNLMVVNNGLLDIRDNNPLRQRDNKKPTSEAKLSEEVLKKQIETILNSDMEENRELVFGKSASKDDQNSVDSASAQNLANHIAIRNQIRANQIMMGRPRAVGGSGVSIEFGKRWKEQNHDFQLLGEIENLQQLSFVEQTITSEMVKEFSRISTLTKLIFDNCEFEFTQKPEWNSLVELELKDQDVTTKLVEAWSTIPSLRTLKFSACSIKDDALNALSESKSLMSLQFDETEIEAAVFDSLAILNQVNYVNLTACKFQTKDYKALLAFRPNLQVTFTAQAFFGVRGPINVGVRERFRLDENGRPVAVITDDQTGCSITDVIAGSGAHKAGIKIGDVIEKVNGQEIEKFEDLRLHIAQFRAGEKLDVTVRRGDKPLELQVELGSQKSAPRFQP